MNCDRCPHMKRILAALKPCQNCEAGKLHGQVGITSETVDWAANMDKHDGWAADRNQLDDSYSQRDYDEEPEQPTGVTNLSPDDEDKLRRAMASLFALDPIELLMVQHIMHGGSYASFGQPLAKIVRRLRVREAELTGKKQGFRQLAKLWADGIAAKMPQLRPVMVARIDPNATIAQDERKRGKEREE